MELFLEALPIRLGLFGKESRLLRNIPDSLLRTGSRLEETGVALLIFVQVLSEVQGLSRL